MLVQNQFLRLWFLALLIVVPGPNQFALAAESALRYQATPTDVNQHTFEVVSIRKSDPNVRTSGSRMDDSGLTMNNVGLVELIERAYGLTHSGRRQIINLPSWATRQGFDIHAKLNEGDREIYQKLDQTHGEEFLQRLLRSMLADRFKLQAHQELRNLPIYALIAKGRRRVTSGPLSAAAPSAEPTGGYIIKAGQIDADHIDMDMFASILTTVADRTVVNRTDLAGNYSFTLKWTPEEAADADVTASHDEPLLFTALQEQLGLKLEPQVGPVSVVVVDRVERQSEN